MLSLSDLTAKNRAGLPLGIPCFCTANEYVLKACLTYASKNNLPLVIEATCNQVNQEGGYTGITPENFMAWVRDLAQTYELDTDLLTMGGDHLGPNPWRHLPVDEAMQRACDLVKHYVEAGFTKIHLDASMACGGEANPSFEQIAQRAAQLCAVAETHAPEPSKLSYVIGTEVPIPGGETDEPDAIDVTSVDSFIQTINTHRSAWKQRGLESAWSRIVGVVTQPGVDFGHTSIYPYDAHKARDLSKAILEHPNIVFEAHSTDYQTTEALADLVNDHFMFLKVGPELTFRFREAVFALSNICSELADSSENDFEAFIDQTMIEHPEHWKAYYSGTEQEQKQLRKFSYSDRIRYYWDMSEVAKRLDTLINSEVLENMPETVVSQYFMGHEFGDIPKSASQLIESKITKCVARYYRAAGLS